MWWWFFFGVQAITSALSVLFNSTLIYLVCRYTGRQLDSYQYLIIVYAVFEMTYSILLFLAMPVSSIFSYLPLNCRSTSCPPPLGSFIPTTDGLQRPLLGLQAHLWTAPSLNCGWASWYYTLSTATC